MTRSDCIDPPNSLYGMRKCGAVCGALRPRSVFQICILHALEFQGLTAGEGEEGEITAKSERLSCGGL